MYSQVKIAGHPVHPMLVGFPVTLYVASLACFAANAFGADPFWFRVGVYSNLAGVILAAIAAVPGFIDWYFGVPAGTPAKATGLTHLSLNVAALVDFVVNVFLQWNHRFDAVPPVGLSVILPLLGVALTAAAGFQGWKMVQTHHVGVDLTPEDEARAPRGDVHGPLTDANRRQRAG